MSKRRGGAALVAVAAIGWGTWPLVMRHAPMPSELHAVLLMAVVTVISLPLMLRDRVQVRARPRDWLGIVWLGIADSANVGLFFAAYHRTTVAIAVLTHYLTPIFVALGEPYILGARMRHRTMLCVATALVGLGLLLQPWRVELSVSDLAGAALGAGSAVFYASNVLVTKRLAGVFSASETMFYHGLVGIPLLWAFVPRGALASTPASSIIGILGASVVIGALGGLMFIWGLRRSVASHASTLTLLEPLIAVVIGAVFFGERLGAVPIAGGCLILVGAVAVVSAGPQTTTDRVESISS